MSSMNSRFKGLGFGSKRKSSANVPTIAQNPTSSTPQLPGRPVPSTASTSTTSLPMNHPGPGGRPPSYTNNYSPGPASVGRTQSPMAGTPRTPPTQVMGGPPPINTAASGYPPGHPAGGMGAQPPAGGPPQYGPPQYGAPIPGGGSVAAAQYANRNNAVEVEGAGRSKAQLIVGIDFVSHSF
jgi:hypothetical protein